MSMLCLLLILVFCFVIRAFPRVKLKYGISSDTFYHLKQAKLIRKNKFRIFLEQKNSVIKIIYSYPFLYHWLLALVPDKQRLWAERLTGAVFDTLSIIVIYCFLNRFAGLKDQIFNLSICFLYAVSPALLRFNGGPRSFNGSPRILGQLLYMTHLFAYYQYHVTGNYFAASLSVITGGLMFISSKFSIQVLLFFFPFICILYDPYYCLFIICGFLFISVASFGLVVRVMKGHFQHSKFLKERIPRQSPWQNTFRGYLYNLRKSIKALFKFQYKEAFRYFHQENYSLHNILFYYPTFFILFNVNYFNEHRLMYVIVFASISLFAFTSLKRFKFLGEPIRYLDYALIPSYILSYMFLWENNQVWVFYAFIFYSLISVGSFINQYYELYKEIDSDYRALENAYSRINSMEKGNLFAFSSNGHSSFYFSHQRVVNALIGNLNVDLFSKEESDLVIGNYPYPGKDFDKLVSICRVKYLVLNKKELNYYTTKILDRPEDFYQRTTQLFETKTALFYKVS